MTKHALDLAPASRSDLPIYALRHRQPDETPEEYDDRVLAAEAQAYRYFERATAPQRRGYMRALFKTRGKSEAESARLLRAANAAWTRTTKQQAELFDVTADEIMRNGCVSYRTEREWLAFDPAQVERAA